VPGYKQYEYIGKELPDLFAIADIVVSRAGANAICQLLALKKPTLLIPLSAKASRGDQILNAKSFEKQGFSKVLMEEDVTDESLLKAIKELSADKAKYIEAMEKNASKDAIVSIVDILDNM